MRILILGAGKMGIFFTDVLSFQHDCAVYAGRGGCRLVYNQPLTLAYYIAP